jgi:hypothetical protein
MYNLKTAKLLWLSFRQIFYFASAESQLCWCHQHSCHPPGKAVGMSCYNIAWMKLSTRMKAVNPVVKLWSLINGLLLSIRATAGDATSLTLTSCCIPNHWVFTTRSQLFKRILLDYVILKYFYSMCHIGNFVKRQICLRIVIPQTSLLLV